MAKAGDRETPLNTSTSGSHHSNQEENKPTLRKQRPQAETWRAEKRKTDRFSILCFPKREGRHHRRNGEWPKKGEARQD